MKRIIVNYFVMPIVWILVALTSFVFFVGDVVVWLLTFWWDRQLWLLHRYSTVWALFYIWVNPFWRIKFEGRENVRKGQAYIIVSNHQSAFDIVLLYRLWMHFKWVAKREIFRIPFIGWNLWLNRHIVIDRASVRGAKKMLIEAQKHLKMGSSVLIFPEGTRSIDGAIKRFKDGAFVLAKKTNIPILPVVINGSKEVFPKYGYTLKGAQTFNMKILPEISAAEYVGKDVDTLIQDIQEIMSKVHQDMAPEYYS
ncbi:MAG: lysophospholipid acyltransferase family protein [Tenuifilaceae bacterium]|nr:lysophospholipid acyltransferase family protein [Tenuifilaceae bacterium]